MQKPASILNPDDNGSPATDEGRRRGPLKFAYASGSKPLQGYTIKRGIGVGGFGDVYYATSDAGKEVALKRIQRNLDVELRGVKQCLNLKHPNLVALFDIRYDEQDQAWVVMEYVSGESLGDVIERNPNGMPDEEVRKWFQSIAQGVSYLHDHGIVHRDLKPGNIFIDQSIVKIGDYGLSKFISCSRRSGQTESVGTFHYMAPEIGLGRYGKEIDIYALGILLYEMLTGRVPFEGESSQEIIMKHLTSQPKLDRLDPPYRQVVSKALSKDPAQRYQSVSEMVAALGMIAGSADGMPKRLKSSRPVLANVVHEGNRKKDTSSTPQQPEEPIAKYVTGKLTDLKNWWQQAEMNSPAQVILLVVAAVLVSISAGWLIPLAFTLAVVYAVYYLCWLLVTSSGSNKSTVNAPLVAELVRDPGRHKTKPAVSPQRRRRSQTLTRQVLNERYRDWLGSKGWLVHSAELTGSMLMAVVVSAVMSLLMMVIGSQNLDASFYGWGPLYAWQCITSVIGAWSILFLTKFWESSSGDHALRRFCMLAAGLFVGAFAGLLARFLLLEPNYIGSWEGLRDALGAEFPALYDATGSPRMLAYLGYFGGLFLILRWWLNADPLRSARLGIMTTIVTVVFALLLYAIIPIPRGFMVAATIAVAVQLSAPWVNHHQRKQLKEKLINEV